MVTAHLAAARQELKDGHDIGLQGNTGRQIAAIESAIGHVLDAIGEIEMRKREVEERRQAHRRRGDD